MISRTRTRSRGKKKELQRLETGQNEIRSRRKKRITKTGNWSRRNKVKRKKRKNYKDWKFIKSQ